MSSTVILTTPLLENQTALYSFILVDETGAGVNQSILTAMTLTYYDKYTGQILNNRQAQNVLNSNSVSLVTVAGPPLVTTVTWTLQPLDTVLVDVRHELEQHIALFEWTWAGGARKAAHEVAFSVEQVTYVV